MQISFWDHLTPNPDMPQRPPGLARFAFRRNPAVNERRCLACRYGLYSRVATPLAHPIGASLGVYHTGLGLDPAPARVGPTNSAVCVAVVTPWFSDAAELHPPVSRVPLGSVAAKKPAPRCADPRSCQWDRVKLMG